jgi:hypothetical protein
MNKAMQLKAKIRNLALEKHIPAQAVLQNFMMERLLERVSVSQYKDQFVLKGGVLVAALVGISSSARCNSSTAHGYQTRNRSSYIRLLLPSCALAEPLI